MNSLANLSVGDLLEVTRHFWIIGNESANVGSAAVLISMQKPLGHYPEKLVYYTILISEKKLTLTSDFISSYFRKIEKL